MIVNWDAESIRGSIGWELSDLSGRLTGHADHQDFNFGCPTSSRRNRPIRHDIACGVHRRNPDGESDPRAKSNEPADALPNCFAYAKPHYRRHRPPN
jgi:hypothetical protein